MAQLGETIHDAIHPILMVVQYSLFPCQGVFFVFVDQSDDMEAMCFKVWVQGNKLSVLAWILTESLDVISGFPSSLETCTSNWVLIPCMVSLNVRASDNFLALSNIFLIV